VNAHEVKPVRLIQSLCAVWDSNLADLTLLYIVLPCVAAVVSRHAWRMLALLIALYVSNLINKHYSLLYDSFDYRSTRPWPAKIFKLNSATDHLWRVNKWWNQSVSKVVFTYMHSSRTVFHQRRWKSKFDTHHPKPCDDEDSPCVNGKGPKYSLTDLQKIDRVDNVTDTYICARFGVDTSTGASVQTSKKERKLFVFIYFSFVYTFFSEKTFCPQSHAKLCPKTGPSFVFGQNHILVKIYQWTTLIVNRQSGVEDSKYVVFDPRLTDHVTWLMCRLLNGLWHKAENYFGT